MKTTLITMFDIKSVKTFDVFSFEVKGEPKGLGFVINGIPYMLWTHVYQNLEMTRQHARKIVSGLKEGTQVISISNEQMNALNTRVNGAFTLGFSTPVYYFVTAEGFNRAIMEVDTSGMKDKKIAAAIEKRKDEMAHVFTEYTNGTLALPAGKKPRTLKSMDVKSFTPVAPVLKDNLSACRSIGMDKRTATITALTLTEKETGKDLSPLKSYCETHYDFKFPRLANKNIFSSTAIAEKFGKSSKVSNQFLSENGLLIKIGDAWGLTDLGAKFGEMEGTEIRTGNKVTVRYNPKWSSDVVAYLKKKNPVKGQKTLN